MAKNNSKRASLSVESLESRQLLSAAPVSLLATPLVAPSALQVTTAASVTVANQVKTTTVPASTSPVQVIVPPMTDTAYLLVPTQVTTGGSKVSTTTTPIQIIVPPEVLHTPVTNGTIRPPDLTLQFIAPTGPVDVQLHGNTPRDVATFLDYVESGAFNNTLFGRLALGTSNSAKPAVSHATVNANGSLTLTGGTTVTLLPTTLTVPSTLTFEFLTSAGPTVVHLNGAKTPETVATFMRSIESGAIDKALYLRLPSHPQTGSTMAVDLQASGTDGSIILTGDSTGSSDTFVLEDGTIVELAPETQSDGTNSNYQIDYTPGPVADNNQHQGDSTATLVDAINSLVATAKKFAGYFSNGLTAGEEDSLRDRLDVLNEKIPGLENKVTDKVAAVVTDLQAGNFQALGEALDQLGTALNNLAAAQNALAAGEAALK